MAERVYPFPLPVTVPAWQLPMIMRQLRAGMGENWRELPYDSVNKLEEAIQYRGPLKVTQQMLDELPDPVWDRIKIVFGLH